MTPHLHTRSTRRDVPGLGGSSPSSILFTFQHSGPPPGREELCSSELFVHLDTTVGAWTPPKVRMVMNGRSNFSGRPGDTRTWRTTGRQRGNRNVQVRMAISIKEAMMNNEKTINYKLPSGREEFATVKIPAGVQHGVTFKFSGMGDDSVKNMPRGDLMVVMSVLDSDGYTRKGNDLFTDKTINCFQAVRGHEFNLKTLEDKIIKVKVPAGTQPGTLLSVKGQGMPVHKTLNIRGNLYVKIHILIPQLSAQDLKKIKDL